MRLPSMFLIRHALKFSRQHFSKNGWEDSEYGFYMQDPDWYEIDSKETAEFLGLKWIGRPYVHIPQTSRGRYDVWWHMVSWIEVIYYILSGEMSKDMCQDADDRMLMNAM